MIDLSQYDNEAVRRGVAQLAELVRGYEGDRSDGIEEFEAEALETAYALDEEVHEDGCEDEALFYEIVQEVIERAYRKAGIE